MEFVSGWYPDPAGAAQLRFWDGQNWTTATAAPAAQQAYELPQTTGFSQPARLTVAGSLARRPPRRPLNFYGVVAGLAAVFVLAAIAIPLAFSSSHSDGSASGGGLKPGSIHLPASFAGFNRITGGRKTTFEQGVAATWPLSTRRVAGLYGVASQPRMGVVAGSLPLSASGISDFMAGMEEGVTRSGMPVQFESESVGPYGGQLECATGPVTISNPTQVTICLFADSSNVGVVFAEGPAASSLDEAMQLRSQVETPPVT